MKTLAFLISLLLAFPSFVSDDDGETEGASTPQCQSAAIGTLRNAMDNHIVWSNRIFSVRNSSAVHDRGLAYVSLTHVLKPQWTCYTWKVRLELPQCINVPTSGQGHNQLTNMLSLTKENLSHDAEFNVVIEFDHSTRTRDETAGDFSDPCNTHFRYRDLRGQFVVSLVAQNNTDVNVDLPKRGETKTEWILPVEFIAAPFK